MTPSADDIATMDASKAARGESKLQEKAVASANKPETIEPSHFMNVEKVALREIVNAEVECQVADSLKDMAATAVKETSMDSIRLTTSSIASQKKSTLSGLTDGWIS